MRCGRILVEGEAEEVAAFPSPRSSRLPRRQQSRNKKDGKVKGSNPYSARGLEKFASLHEELAAKREYVARKTGASEDLVRFCYTSKGWVPVVVKSGRSGGGGGGDPRVSILRPLRKKKDNGGCEENVNGRGENDNGCLEIENGCENHENVGVESVAPWSGYVVTTAFGVLSLSALILRKSVVPAAAMAMVMVVGALQKRWQGGVMCMKKFVVSGLGYFSGLIVHWKNKMVKKEAEKIVENQIQIQTQNQNQNQNRPENVINEIKKKHGKSLSVSISSLRGQNEIHQSSPKQGGAKSKEYGRIVSMDGQPRKPIRSDVHKSDSPLRGGQIETHQSITKQGGSKSKEYGRIVSMDGQPRKPIISDYHKSDSFDRSFKTRRIKKGGVASSPAVGATVMIIVLICLIFYGRLCAILFTSAWWYLLPKVRIEANSSKSGDFSKMDLKQRELRKKRVIMDGLLDRSHNNNNMGRS